MTFKEKLGKFADLGLKFFPIILIGTIIAAIISWNIGNQRINQLYVAGNTTNYCRQFKNQSDRKDCNCIFRIENIQGEFLAGCNENISNVIFELRDRQIMVG